MVARRREARGLLPRATPQLRGLHASTSKRCRLRSSWAPSPRPGRAQDCRVRALRGECWRPAAGLWARARGTRASGAARGRDSERVPVQRRDPRKAERPSPAPRAAFWADSRPLRRGWRPRTLGHEVRSACGSSCRAAAAPSSRASRHSRRLPGQLGSRPPCGSRDPRRRGTGTHAGF